MKKYFFVRFTFAHKSHQTKKTNLSLTNNLSMKKLLYLSLFTVFLPVLSYGQLIDRMMRKVEDKVVEKTGDAIDKASQKKKDKTQKEESPSTHADTGNTQTETDKPTSDTTPEPATNAENASLKITPLKAYSKFDFVPGDKVIAYEDFSSVGPDDDLPTGWNTNASSEMVTLNNYPGKWMALKGSSFSAFLPEFVTSIPENATIEFEMIPTDDSGILYFQFFNAEHNRRKINWNDYQNDGVAIDLYGAWIQMESYIPNEETFHSNSDNSVRGFFEENVNKPIKVSVWRQKERLRMYLNDHKVMDIARACAPTTTYNTIQFVKRSDDDVYIRNIRVAVGSPDIRTKLAAGKFTTNGILFDVNEDRIKPESYGVLKQIAEALKATPAMKVKIIGHTDSDGDAAKNTDLSKRRAAAVKNALSAEFGIDATRLTTDGKGATQPIASNTTADGKANNRRVEFIKVD